MCKYTDIYNYIYMYTYKKMYVNTYTYVFTHMCILYIYICAFQIEMTSVWIIMENLTFSDNFTETT